jgi:integrase/recombinase XerC
MEAKYSDQINRKNQLKLREMLKELPAFCREFFIGIEQSTASRTRLAYAYDLRIFFRYIQENNPLYHDIPMHEIPISILEQITATDIEEYLSYLRIYDQEGNEHTNDERGLSRKLACLRSFYNYFYQKEIIEKNPAVLVSMPKLHRKNIIRLDQDEVARLLDQVENGEGLTEKQKVYHAKTKTRDFALLTLLLGTGIRVSECVGLNMQDVDLNNNGINVQRKGGSEATVYFGSEVESALLSYLEERKNAKTYSEDEQALFLSMQGKRISVRAVENLVKKYAKTVTSLKKITPHKLRSTYGTSLYRETGDIYLVADVLGHKDINTTRKHYAAIEEDRRRMAANKVQLRDE